MMIKKTYTFKTPAKNVWDTLTDPFMIFEWSGYPATMSPQAGTQFSLWEGDVHGTNIEVVPQQKLVQNWFGGDWDAPSVVTFTLHEENGVTTLELEQTGIPDYETADFDTAWDKFYLEPIKRLLEPYALPPEPTLPNGMKASEIFDEAILDTLQAPAANQPTSSQPPQNPPSQEPPSGPTASF